MSEYYMHKKFKVYPTEEQKIIIDRMISLYRFVYNWAIAEEREIYEQYKNGSSLKQFYSAFELNMRFSNFRNRSENFWLKDITIGCARGAIKDAVHAYEMFFSGYNGRPGFKKKQSSPKICRLRHDKFYIDGSGVRIDGLPRHHRISLGMDNTGFGRRDKYYSPMIMKDKLDEYYISFAFKTESAPLDKPKTEALGIDIGVRHTYTLSTGEIFNQPDISKYRHRLKILHRRVTRDINRRYDEAQRTKTKYEQIQKSKRAIRRERQFRKCHKKIHDIHMTFYDQVTNAIIQRNPKAIIMETFKVNDVIQGRKFMRKIMQDTYFYTMLEKIKLKCMAYEILFIQVPKDYPSSRICSSCGSIKNIHSDHIYHCNQCGLVIDRDINAAINLRNFISLLPKC